MPDLRSRSPVDGVERFAAVRAVPDYPLAVVVSRDVQSALAEWRAQATGTALRTLSLGLLGVLLLALLARQLRRLDAANESLKDSRERFALAVAGSDDGIWDWDRASDAVFASARARELYGLPPGPEETPRDAWHAQVQVHPDDVAPRFAAVEANMAGRTPLYEFEYRVRHPDGRYRWVRARGLCVRDADGVALRMAGSVSDIDTRRRTEEALRVSEERFALPSPARTSGSGTGPARWHGVRVDTRARDPGPAAGQELQRLDDLVASLRVHPDDAPLRAERISAHLQARPGLRSRLPRAPRRRPIPLGARAGAVHPRRRRPAVPDGRLGGRHRRAAPRRGVAAAVGGALRDRDDRL